MKLNKLTIDYAVTRSQDFQSVRLGAADQVNAAAAQEMHRVIYGEAE